MSLRRAVRVAVVLSPAFALVAAGVWYAVRQFDKPAPQHPDTGRLVVVAVFDQMRGDYLDRWAALYGPDGFERLKREGAWYADAHLPYATATTGPGHASISTGLPPAAHGIVDNEWYDRAKGKKVYCTTADRPYERVPLHGSRGQDGGMAPDRVLAESVGDALHKATQGKGRVFSLALKDRAAVLLGGKDPDGCYCFDPTAGEFHTSTYYRTRDRVHPWVERFNQSRAADRWFGHDWTRLGEEAVYDQHAGPDDAPGESPPRTFPHQLGRDAGGPGPKYYAALESTPFGNDLVWELAKDCIEGEDLGRGPAADLLWLGFSSNDLIGHPYGPDSHEVLDVTLRSDRLVAEMTKYLDDRLGAGRYTLIVTSDHGICPLPERSVREHPEAERFHFAEEFGQLGAVLDERFGRRDVAAGAWVEPGVPPAGAFPWFYLNRRLAESQGVPPAEVEEAAAQWVGNRPAAQAAYTRTQLAGPPLADPVGRMVQLSFHPARCGDVYVVTRPYLLPLGKTSTGTTHGTPHDYDTHVPVLAFGRGVPGLGKRTERVSSLVVAPIVCRALGLDPPAGLEKLPAGWE